MAEKITLSTVERGESAILLKVARVSIPTRSGQPSLATHREAALGVFFRGAEELIATSNAGYM